MYIVSLVDIEIAQIVKVLPFGRQATLNVITLHVHAMAVDLLATQGARESTTTFDHGPMLQVDSPNARTANNKSNGLSASPPLYPQMT